MLSFKVRLYANYIVDEYIISGYNYNSSAGWNSPIVMCETSDGTTRTVTFGYDTSNTNSLWVAIPNRRYTGCDIVDCVNGFTQVDTGGLFTLSIVSSLSGTTQSNIIGYPSVKKTTNIQAGTVTVAANTATAVTFPTAFASVPYVTVTSLANSNGYYRISSGPTKTGFSIMSEVAGSFDWIAVSL